MKKNYKLALPLALLLGVSFSNAQVVTITPADGSVDTAIDVSPTISFDETVRLIDNSAINDANVDALVEVRIGDETGALVPFDATFAGNVITINPTADLDNGQDYYIALLPNVVEDVADNAITDTNAAIFTTIAIGGGDTDEPVVTITPTDGTIDVAINVNPTISFDEPVRLTDNTAIDDTNVDALVEVRVGDEFGAPVPFDATFAGNVITIDPVADLDNDQDYYIALLPGVVEDFSDNAVADTNAAIFTTVAIGGGDTDEPVVTITPTDGAINVAINVNPTISFDEPVRLTDNTAIDDTNVDALVEVRLGDETGALVPFDATFAGNVITINPVADLDNDQDYYIALLGGVVEDLSDNAVADINAAIFTTAAVGSDTDAPVVTITPADAAIDVAVNVSPTISFDEAVRLTDNTAIDDTNVDALVELRIGDATGALVPFDATFAGNVITIDPAADLDNDQDYYVALLPNVVEDLSDNAVTDVNEAIFTTIAAGSDTTPPVVTITPADAAIDVAVDVNPTISFDEAVRLTDNTAIDDTNVDALVELRIGDATGALVPFDATFAGNVITINPVADLANDQDYYVALLPNVVEDLSDNAVTDANDATFTTIAGGDTTAPVVTIAPADAAINVAVNVSPTIAFDEAVRLTDNSAIDDTNVDALVELRIGDATGALVPFDATFTGNVITINPVADLANDQDYYVALLPNVVEDFSDNAVTDTNDATFTTIAGGDTTAPIVTITPADAAINVAVNVSPTIAFDEAVRLADNTAIDDTNVDALVELRIGDATGALVPFDATFAGNVITINPVADLANNQDYYVALLPNGVEDLSDNAVTDTNDATFTTVGGGDTTAPAVTITPADAAVNVPITVSPTIAFDEAVRLTDNTAIDDTNVDALVELRIGDATGALVPFDATFAGNVITINPVADLANDQDYYVALLPGVVEDLSDNAVADAASAIFTTEPGLGTQGFAANSAFQLYPNPSSSGIVYFNRSTSVTVFDATGKMLFSSNNIKSIDTSGLSGGLYLVKTSEGSTVKLIVR